MKVGVIGSGFAAQAHIEALRRLPDVEITAIVSRTHDKAKLLAGLYRIPNVYHNIDQLIEDARVEVIHNCTSNDAHFQVNRKVLLAGMHLMSEKPLAMNSEESLELVELARKSPGIHGVCFNYRHYPMVVEARHRIMNGQYGRTFSVSGSYLQDWLLKDTDYNWRLHPEYNGPSRAVADIGSHWCDVVQYVLGKRIVNVFADLQTVHKVRKIRTDPDGDWQPIGIETEDCGHVLVHFEDGSRGGFSVSQVSAGRKNQLKFEIAAEKASIAWDQEEPNRLWVGSRDEPNMELMKGSSLLSKEAATNARYPEGHPEGWPDGLRNTFEAFYGAIKNPQLLKQGVFATFEDGHRMNVIVDAILRSHRTQSWISVS